jgi:uncharacterized protein
MIGIARAVGAATATAMLVVLTGCVGTDATVAAPTATVDGGRPPDYASAGSVGSGPVAQVADQTVFTPAAAPDTTVPFAAAADGIVESMVWVPAGDHRVPGTLAMPASPPAGAIPVVLLLHGDLSDRNENGDLFTRLAAALAAQGVASLRIDFAGSGDSEEPDLALDYPGMVTDAAASVDYLRADPRFDPTRVAVLGLSRGGAIAATLAGTVPGVAALVEWSGAVYNGHDEDPEAHDRARADGFVILGGGFRLSLNWFDSIEQSHPLDDVAGFTGPVLAVTGSDDGVVPPEVSDVLLQTVASTDTTRHSIDGADHEFDATTDDQSHAQEALTVTTDWLTARFGAAPTS